MKATSYLWKKPEIFDRKSPKKTARRCLPPSLSCSPSDMWVVWEIWGEMVARIWSKNGELSSFFPSFFWPAKVREKREVCCVNLPLEDWGICGQNLCKNQLGIVRAREYHTTVFSLVCYTCVLNLQCNSFNTIIIHS